MRKSLASIANEHKLDIDETIKTYQYEIKKLYKRAPTNPLKLDEVYNRNTIANQALEIVDRYYKIKNTKK